jgi:hypothetical protein
MAAAGLSGFPDRPEPSVNTASLSIYAWKANLMIARFSANDGSVCLGKKGNRHRRFDSDVY